MKPTRASMFTLVTISVLCLRPGFAPPSQTPPQILEKLAQIARPYDEPAQAERFYQMKRSVTDDGSRDVQERYSRALRRMRAMPRFSSKTGRVSLPAPSSHPGARPRSDAGSLGTWDPLGPGNIGGRTRAVLIDPTQPSRLFAAGVSGGIWKTENGGASWRPLGDMLPNIAVASMAMNPDDPRILYAGSGEGQFREVIRGTSLPLRGAGIFKSVDGGEVWKRLATTANEDFYWVNDVAISHSDPQRLYAATRTGVWRSSNAGENWSRILETQVNGGCYDLALRSDLQEDMLFAACGTFEQATIFRNVTAEGESAFEAVHTEAGMGLTSLAIAPSNQNLIYALSASHVGGPSGLFNGGLHAVYRSVNSGSAGSWIARVRNTNPVKLNTLLLTNPVIASLVECGFGPTNFYSTLGWYTNVIAVDPTNQDTLFAGGVDLFRSNDGGRSWGLITHWFAGSSAHADQHAIVFHPSWDGVSNQTFFLGGDGGVYRTDNALALKAIGRLASCSSSNTGVTWTNLNNNLEITQFYHGTPFPDGRTFFGGTQDNGTVFGSDEGGTGGWRNILGGDGGYTAVDPTDTSVLYAESQGLAFSKSVDGGATFTPATAGISEPGSNFLFITPFTMDPNDPGRLWIGGRRIWRTENGAVRWQAASPQLSAEGKISAIAAAPGNSNRVLVGRSDGSIHRQTQALSAFGTTPWEEARPRDGFVSWLAFDPDDSEIAYAAYAGFGGQHVWKSSDGGAQWIGIDGSGADGLPDIPVHSIIVDRRDRHRLYLGTDLGVFVSRRGGSHWAVENTGFANVVTESLSLVEPVEGAPTLFAFTHGRGAWKVELSELEAPCSPDRWVAHVTPEGVGFSTTVLASNGSDQAATIELVPFEEDGSMLAAVPVEVPGGGSTIVASTDLFGDLDVSHFGICGSPSVAVSVGYRITSIEGATAHVNETSVIDQEFLIYPGEWPIVFDGMSVVNVGEGESEVTAVLENADGQEIRSVVLHQGLPPKAKHLAVLDAEFIGATGARIRVVTTQPSIVLILRGTRPGVEPMLLWETAAVPLSPLK